MGAVWQGLLGAVVLVKGKGSKEVDVLCFFQTISAFPLWKSLEPNPQHLSLGVLEKGEGSLQERSPDLWNP